MRMAGDTAQIEIMAGIPVDITPGSYEILLHLSDPVPVLHSRPEYAIRLANNGVWEDSTGYNSLLHTMEVSLSAPGDIYNGDNFFKPLDDNPTGMKTDDRQIPINFKLKGNYPNPFNGTTVIAFDLQQYSDVKLDIINVNGRLIDSIVDRKYPSGSHRVLWDPENISSGTYFYRLTVDGMSQVGQALYIK